MALFYFHICTTAEMVRDKAGREFASLCDALEFAERYARLLQAKTAYAHIDFRVVEIRDGSGNLTATVPFPSRQAYIVAPPSIAASRRIGSLAKRALGVTTSAAGKTLVERARNS